MFTFTTLLSQHTHTHSQHNIPPRELVTSIMQAPSYENERPLPSPTQSPPRSSSSCVMDIDSELADKRPGCFMPSLKKKQRRSVTFQNRSLLYRYDVPEDESQEWYTGVDEDIFKKEARKDLAIFQRIKGGFNLNGAAGQSAPDPQPQHNEIDSLCIVGLEQQLVSPEFSKKRARTKKLVKYAVLLEQSRIDFGGNYYDKADRIAEAAARYSEWSAAQAKMFGDFQHIQSKESR